MSLYQAQEVRADMSQKQLANLVAELMYDIEFIINGNLDTRNIRELHASVIVANSITAEKMSVTELSAISANLGEINAGIVRGVQIYGSHIATREGAVYPKVELSNAQNLLTAYKTPSRSIYISASAEPSATFSFVHDTERADMFLTASSFIIGTITTPINITSGRDLRFTVQAGYGVYVPDWVRFKNNASGRSLQDELNSIYNEFNTVYAMINSIINS